MKKAGLLKMSQARSTNIEEICLDSCSLQRPCRGGGGEGGVHVAHLNLRKFFVFVGIGEKGDSDAL